MRGATFSWAIKELKKGYCVYRGAWPYGYRLRMKQVDLSERGDEEPTDRILCLHSPTQSVIYQPSQDDLLADDWKNE